MSGLVDRLRHRARVFVYRKRFGAKWAEPLARHGIFPPPNSSIDERGHLQIFDLGASVPEPNPVALKTLRAVRLLTDLHLRAGANFQFRERDVEVRVGGITAIAEETADIHVFHEVFVERIYDFQRPGSYTVIDIGMNIGLASLFFAKEYGAQVHAFELIPSTFELAQRNLHLNPELAAKITVHPFGLSDKDSELQIRFSPQDRAGGSMFSTTSLSDATDVNATVKDVAPFLSQAIEDLDGRQLVLKVDAEGAEYEILERLDSEGLLPKVNVVLLEWHPRQGKDPEELRERLKRNGFQWFERRHPEVNVGLISAFRS